MTQVRHQRCGPQLTHLQNPELSELIFRRVSPHLPQTLSVASGARHAAPYTEGVWSVAGLNDKWRFCKYVTQGRFSAHTYVSLLCVCVRVCMRARVVSLNVAAMETMCRAQTSALCSH